MRAALKDVLPGLVVIFVTGLSDAATMIEASQAGGDDFLVKPLDAARCLVTIRFRDSPQAQPGYQGLQSRITANSPIEAS